MAALPTLAMAQAFSPGSLSVLLTTDNTTPNAVAGQVEVYNLLGFGLNTYFFDTTGARRITFEGNNINAGHMSRSGNGAFLLAPGYDAPTGTSSIAGTLANTTFRSAAILGWDAYGGLGYFNRRLVFPGAVTARGLASQDGNGVYYVTNQGIQLSTTDASSTTLVDNPLGPGSHSGAVFSGRLFTGAANSTYGGVGAGIWAAPAATPLPTTGLSFVRMTSAPGSTPGTGGFAFMRDPIPANGGVVRLYTGEVPVGATSGLYKWAFDGTNNSATSLSSTQVNATGVRSVATDGDVLYVVTQGATAGANSLFAVRESTTGTYTSRLLDNSPATGMFTSVALSPEPALVGSDINPAAGNNVAMAYRTNTGFDRQVRVGLVDRNNEGVWNQLTAITYVGHLLPRVRVGGDGNIYLVRYRLNTAMDGYVMNIIRVNSGTGVVTQTSDIAVTAGFTPVSFAVSSGSNTAVVAQNIAQQSIVITVNSAFSSTTTLTNGGFFYTFLDTNVDTYDAVDVAYSRDATPQIRLLYKSPFQGFGQYAIVSVNPTGGAPTLPGSQSSVPPVGGTIGIDPVRLAYGTDNSPRLLSTGVDATMALFRVDTLNAGGTAITGQGVAYRRDATGVTDAGNTASTSTSVQGLAAQHLGMQGNNPIVGLVNTSVLSNGSNGNFLAPALNNGILGSGRVWFLDATSGAFFNRIARATRRFYPGYAPMN